MQNSTYVLAVAIWGCVLAAICWVLFGSFEAAAILRMSELQQAGRHALAGLAYAAIRGLPLLIVGIVVGALLARSLSLRHPLALTAFAIPWFGTLCVVSSQECVAAGEAALCWLNYRPLYMLLVAFASLPVGLFLATVLPNSWRARSAA
jgi:hypothetical protein